MVFRIMTLTAISRQAIAIANATLLDELVTNAKQVSLLVHIDAVLTKVVLVFLFFVLFV